MSKKSADENTGPIVPMPVRSLADVARELRYEQEIREEWIHASLEFVRAAAMGDEQLVAHWDRQVKLLEPTVMLAAEKRRSRWNAWD